MSGTAATDTRAPGGAVSLLTAEELGEVLEMEDLAGGVHEEHGSCSACARLDATIAELRRIRARWTDAHDRACLARCKNDLCRQTGSCWFPQ